MQKYWWKANPQKDFLYLWRINYSDLAIINFLWDFFVYGPFSYFGIKYLVVWHLWNILYEIFMKLVEGDMTMMGWLLRAPHFSDPTDPVHIKQQGDHVVLKSLSTHVHWRGFQ